MIEKRRIGTDSVHAIGLGCMNLNHAYGPGLPEDESIHFLQKALDLGYDFLDTASLYGDGKNEELIGKALKHRRQEFFLASKCVLGFVDGKRALDGRPEIIRQHCADSLRRLQTDTIDLYYMHRLDRKVPVEDSIGALADLVAEGKIRHIGMSEVSAATLRRAHATHPIAAIQSEYSLMTRNPEIAVLDACRELGIAFVAFSPVCRGLFSDQPLDPGGFHESDLRSTFPRFSDDNFTRNMELLAAAYQCAEELGCGLPQLALAWVLAQGKDILAIPGTKNLDHLIQNFKALNLELPADRVAELGRHFAPQRVAGNRYPERAQRTVDTEQFDFET